MTYDPPTPPEPKLCRLCNEPMKQHRTGRQYEEWYCANPNCPDPSPDEIERQRQKNRRTQSKRQNLLDAMAEEAGWDGISEVLTAYIRGELKMPQKVE